MTTTIGRYRVTRRLDGAGEAYLATGDDGKRWILRLYSLQPEDDQWTEAQLHASICAKIDHANVCRVGELFHEGGKIVDAHEAPPDGATLAELIARLDQEGRTLEPPAAWFLGHAIAAALSAAQAAADDEEDFVALCHGHLSPECVHISWRGDVQVSGFGLAPLVGGAAGIKADPAYAPPEGRPTPRGDMYSLAACVWAALAGTPPSGELAFEVIITSLPPRLADPLQRACARSLGARKVTSLELEHAFGEVLGDGKRKLAAAMTMLRQDPVPATQVSPSATGGPASGRAALGSGGALGTPASRRAGSALTGGRISQTGGAPAAKPGTTAGIGVPRAVTSQTPGGGVPPIRSKYATILGQGPEARAPLPSAPPIDWGAAKEVAQSKAPEVDDDLSWGDEDEEVPTRVARRPDMSRLAAVARDPAAARDDAAEPADPAPAQDDDEEGATRVAQRPPALEKALEKKADAIQGTAVIDVAGDDKPASLRVYPGSEADAAPARPAQDEPAPQTARMDEGDAEQDFAMAVEDTADSLGPRPEASESAPRPVDALLDEALADASPAASLERASGSGASPSDGALPAPTTSSAWVGGDTAVDDDRAPAEPISMLAAVAITIGTAIVVMIAGVAFVRATHTVDPPPPAPAATTTATVKSRVPAPTARASATASATAGSSASASSTSAPAASSAADDGHTLPKDQGYLIVKFPDDQAKVFFFGKPVGKVNDKLTVPCDRPAFVRIGTDIGKWLTAGEPLQIRCQGVTEVSMQPAEP